MLPHVRYWLEVENGAGIRSSNADEEYVLNLLGDVGVPNVSFASPIAPSLVCGAPTDIDVLHASSAELALRWPLLPFAHSTTACLTALGTYTDCTSASGTTAYATTATSNMSLHVPPGSYHLTLRSLSLSGVAATASWKIACDSSPPLCGAVRVDGASASEGYWADGDSMGCSWDAAHDAESGLFSYQVLIVRQTDTCAEPSHERLGGTIVGSVNVSCGERRVELAHVFQHGAAYRCVVRATNGAGLTEVCSSPPTVVDLSSSALGQSLGDVSIAHAAASTVNASTATGPQIGVRFFADLTPPAATRDFGHEAVPLTTALAPLRKFYLTLLKDVKSNA